MCYWPNVVGVEGLGECWGYYVSCLLSVVEEEGLGECWWGVVVVIIVGERQEVLVGEWSSTLYMSEL